jgi:hypothetical protein
MTITVFTNIHGRPHRWIILLALLLMSGAVATPVNSAIHRCISDDDVQIFTDRACSSLGARNRTTEPALRAASFLPTLVHGCSRQIDIFQAQVRGALDAGDVNQLSGLYHWVDATRDTANKLMPELQVISSRRLAKIGVDSFEINGVKQPYRLWLDQYLPDRPGKTIRTDFSLVMNAGCWWLHG